MSALVVHTTDGKEFRAAGVGPDGVAEVLTTIRTGNDPLLEFDFTSGGGGGVVYILRSQIVRLDVI